MKDTNYEGLTSLEASKTLKKDGKNILEQEKKTNKSITWQGIADSLPSNFNIIKSEAWVRKTVSLQK